jgi:hypothetical protein
VQEGKSSFEMFIDVDNKAEFEVGTASPTRIYLTVICIGQVHDSRTEVDTK